MSSKATVNYAAFKLCGIDFSAMDNAFDVDFSFNEAFSLIVAEQCGWIKDKFGISWQIVPENMDDVLFKGSKDEIQRVTEAFLQMKKFNLDALEKARLGN